MALRSADSAKLQRRLEKASTEWREIPGYYYKYRISEYGVVQRYLQESNRWRVLKPYKIGQLRWAVTLIADNRAHKRAYINNLMADIFMGGKAAHKGLVLVHKNGCTSDFYVNNLEWITQKELGRRMGGQGRKSVEKIDKDGNVVALYRSTVECCKHEYISRKTLWRIVNGKSRNPFLPTGYTYRYEEADT